MKTKVAVLFGGKSVEHEVSIISGLQAFAALDRGKYDPLPIYIAKDNTWYTGAHLGDIASYKDIPACLSRATRVLPVASAQGVDLVRYPLKTFARPVVDSFEVALPVVHGTNVEDGTLSGQLETLGVPYAACDVLSSALGMDKYRMKAVLTQAGLPVLPARLFSGRRYATDGEAVLEEIERAIPYPVIVKPVNLGSSVGISRAASRPALQKALDLACGYAAEVLVEQAVSPLREINCAVLGDRDSARSSVCEQPLGQDDILSFQDKYLSGGKTAGKTGAKAGGMSGLKRRCPADIPDDLAQKIQQLAVDTFRTLGCCGVARVDFLNNTDTGEVFVNEINTIPGSLAFYLWEAAGLPFDKLLDEMLQLAFKRSRDREALIFSYETNLLSTVSLGGSKGKNPT